MAKKTPLLLTLLALWLVTLMLWWGLAFFPVPAATTEWVNRAREVCFGTMSNGLPAAYGWMLLIGAPLLMFGAILTLWGHETRESLQGLRQSRGLQVGLMVVTLLALSESAWIGQRVSAALKIPTTPADFAVSNELPDTYPRTDLPAPEFDLVDQHGQKLSLADFKGQVVYLTFAFAHCQTICPGIVTNLLRARNELDVAPVQLIVTLDPWRDTPGALPTLAKQWNLPETAHVLSGSVEEVQKVLADYNVPASRDAKTGDISHPALVYVIGPSGEIAYTLNNAGPAALAEAGRRAVPTVAKK